MFHRIQNQSTRSIVRATLATLLMFVSAVATFAITPVVAPVLVPYTAHTISGNPLSTTGGYGGDGGQATSATLNLPNAIAVDSAGNVYIADTGNALIREVNAQTGIIQTIAGILPTKCTGTVCQTITTGCADGVTGLGNGVGGKVQGIAVDGFGNVYWDDYNTQAVFVLYKAGTQVSNFISLVDPTGVTTAGGVKPGYVYAVAGNFVRSTCKGTTTVSAAGNNVIAGNATFHDPSQLSLDAAGNIYLEDFGNGVARVINTQSTSQTFFGVTLQPGFVGAIVNCSGTASFSFTTPCSTTSGFTGIGKPANQALFGAALAALGVDQYGNVYQLDTKGADPIYAGVAYAGGAALGSLINAEMSQDGQALTATPGDWYSVVDDPFITTANLNALPGPTSFLATALSNIVIRGSAITTDPYGNIYFLDNHWPDIWRVDINTGIATRIFAGYTFTGATPANPIDCGASQATPVTTGITTTDPWGDGCPVSDARVSTGGLGYVTFSGNGDLYLADEGSQIIREVTVNNHFKPTALATPLTQTLQVHFDQTNLPVQVGTAPAITTTSFKIAPGITDFTINGTPTCSSNTTWTTGTPLEASPTTTTPQTIVWDNSLDCYVNVTFTPVEPGVRQAALQATTVNGSVYSFGLTGIGSGPQVAVDGGAQSTLATTGLGSTTSLAVSQSGAVYIADPANNRVVVTSIAGTSQATIGTGLSAPRGVAVDAQGLVYVSDTGNSRVLKIDPSTGTQTTIGSQTPYNGGGYAFHSPQGLAVDASGNVYVADTGNARVVEIPSNPILATAPLLQYPGAPTLVNPVAVAVDNSGNVFVADSGVSAGLIKIQAGGGDLQPTLGSTTLSPAASIVSFGTATLATPNGVAVDAAGDLYVSDGSTNLVEEIPSATGPGHESFTLNFTGLNTPAGLALDANGNVYVADSANSRILIDNRTQVSVPFGTVPQFQPPSNAALTVTNIGNAALTIASPFTQTTGNTTDFSSTTTCTASALGTTKLAAGLHCGLTASFLPVVNGALTASLSVQGGAASVALSGTGEAPLVNIALAVSSPSTGAAFGHDATILATVTQPNGSNVPTGTITFSYTINGVAQTGSTQSLAVSGSSASASFTIPAANILVGRKYVVNAVYSGDGSDTQTTATPLSFAIPGLPLTAVANSVAYTYGSAVPTLSGTVTGILPQDAAGITVTFISGATQSSPVGTYPITVQLTGTNSENYTIPNAVTPAGAPAIVTENPAPLKVVVNNATAIYGTPNVTYTDTITGAVNGDSFNILFTPPQSSVLNVGTYTVAATLSDIPPGTSYDHINNYAVTSSTGTLTITAASSTLTIAPATTAVLPTNLTAAPITITAVPYATGVPTGTVTLSDVFTPITPTGPSAPITEPAIVLTLTAGVVTYTPTNTTLGTHSYSFAYSGDHNFQAYTTITSTNLIVDTPDYTVTSTTDPVLILPGVIPGGVATTPGEQAAYPEQATVTVAPILGYSGTVNLTCTSPSSYVTCTLAPTSVTMTGTTAVQTSIISISTPATLPLNYTSQLRLSTGGRFLAFLPLGALLLFLPGIRNKRRIAKVLWMVLAAIAVSGGITGCGQNSVKFFTPVPTGPQAVTITATSGSLSRTFTVQIEIQ